MFAEVNTRLIRIWSNSRDLDFPDSAPTLGLATVPLRALGVTEKR
jgi:hypothetical protein